MFTRLRTKLTVLYAALFGAGLIMISGAVYAAIVDNAEHMVRGELAAGGAVFDRLWTLRSSQLQDSVGILSRDFGFRSAVATRDQATIGSALTNLKSRLGIDLAFMVGTDGRITSADGRALGGGADDIVNALQSADEAAGVFMIGDTPYQTISVPVMAPMLTGWLVFASKLDKNQMRAIERLSAIPLDASVFHRDAGGGWAATGQPSSSDRFASAFIDRVLSSPARAPQTLMTSAGKAVALVKPLASMNKARPVALVLSYTMARALAPYQSLLTHRPFDRTLRPDGADRRKLGAGA